MTVAEAIKILIPSTELSDWNRQIIKELKLSNEHQRRVLFELECLQILALHFAIMEVFAEEPQKLDAFLNAYVEYWTVYSGAMSINYGEALYKRLRTYGEAIDSQQEQNYTAVGKAFSTLCDVAHENLTGLGANVFNTAFEQTCNVLASMNIASKDDTSA